MIEEKLRKKMLLVALLLVALWALVDDESTSSNSSSIYRTRHHLAIWTALDRHPPCLRIFRALFEFNLMLWGLAASLWLWKSTVGEKMTGYLLFQPADHDDTKDRGVYFTESTLGTYHPLQQHQEERGLYEHDNEDEEEEMDINPIDNSIVDDQLHEISPTSDRFDLIVPPSPINITHAALDFLILILITLFMFTLSSAEGGRYVDGMESIHMFRMIAIVAAPIFPLVLFLAFCAALVFPWNGKRKSQWKILSYTIGAPFYHVTFRDGFIGDILTSSVRPLQDVAFTVFYLLSGLQGWWQQSYDLDAADLPLESNWFLHTMILPMCMMSPLWYRFCQNLRQTYEHKTRWPYLGNALKYFIAAEVGIFGVYKQAKSFAWLVAFVMATLYQIWWDVFMDWELLHVTSWKTFEWNISGRYMSISIPASCQLRKTRIYSVSWIYWGIFGINIVLRFCWTLSFIPAYYLNQAGVLRENFDGDISAALNPIIASAEIIRRTMWGWIRVEWEAIKVARKEPRLKGVWTDHDQDSKDPSQLGTPASSIEFKTMSLSEDVPMDANIMKTSPDTAMQHSLLSPRRMFEMTEIQVLGELCLYATLFTGLGLIAAAHRDTF